MIPFLLVMLVLLYRLPFVSLGGSSLGLALAVALPSLGYILLYLRGHPPRPARPGAGLIVVYLVVVAIAIARAGADGVVYRSLSVAAVHAGLLVYLGLFGLLAIVSAGDERERHRIVLAVCMSPVVYVTVNVGLHIAHVQNASPIAAGNASILGFLGIAQERVLFPLASGLNNFGDIAGAALAISGVIAINCSGRLRFLGSIGALVSAYALAMSDARAAFAFALIAIGLVVALPRLRVIRGLPLLLPLSPAIVLGVLGLLAGSTVAATLSRQGEDFVEATGRSQIWATVIEFLSRFEPAQIFGYGAYGHVTSGVSYQYAFVFSGLEDPAIHTAHNSALQAVLDTGYVGAAILILLLWRIIHGLQDGVYSSPFHAALLASVIAISLVGLTDGAPSIYTPETLVAFVLSGAVAVSVPVLAVLPAGSERSSGQLARAAMSQRGGARS